MGVSLAVRKCKVKAQHATCHHLGIIVRNLVQPSAAEKLIVLRAGLACSPVLCEQAASLFYCMHRLMYANINI